MFSICSQEVKAAELLREQPDSNKASYLSSKVSTDDVDVDTVEVEIWFSSFLLT